MLGCRTERHGGEHQRGYAKTLTGLIRAAAVSSSANQVSKPTPRCGPCCSVQPSGTVASARRGPAPQFAHRSSQRSAREPPTATACDPAQRERQYRNELRRLRAAHPCQSRKNQQPLESGRDAVAAHGGGGSNGVESVCDELTKLLSPRLIEVKPVEGVPFGVAMEASVQVDQG